MQHATRRGGRCVCVVRLLRNGSKTKFFQQPGRFQARTPFPLARPGRASRKPPGTRVTLPPRKAHDTWHSAPNHMEPPSAAPRPGLRGGCHPCLCKCVTRMCMCQCRGTNGTAYPILLPLLGLISPRTRTYGGWDKSWQQPRLCGSGRLTADMGRAINHPSPPGGLTD